MWTKIKSSLSIKSSVFIAIAVTAGILCFAFFNWAGEAAVRRAYSSHDATVERIEILKKDLAETVNPNGKSCNSIIEIHEWLRKQPGISLDAYSAETEQLIYESDGNFDITYRNGETDIRINDNAEYVSILYKNSTIKIVLRDTSYQDYYAVVTIVSLFVSFAVTLIVMLLIFRYTFLNRILTLSKQVRAVSFGETEREVRVKGTDEIKRLGDDIDSMRLSMIDQYEKEQDAIKANNELLTSISHDIRTPLTSIIGYSEMMTDERTTNPEELKKYAEICRDKAYRLKELTDTLFRYFYVYGREETDLQFEKFDAQMLFTQILGEQIVDIMQEGYDVRVPTELEEQAYINIDVDLFKRVLDNVFINLKKYADKAKPIIINGFISEGKVYITIENSVRKGANQAESTKVGLKTCARAMAQFGGSFSVESDGKVFTETLTLPLAK